MTGDTTASAPPPSRRAVLFAGGVLATLAAGAATFAVTESLRPSTAAKPIKPPTPWLKDTPLPALTLHLAAPSTLQDFVLLHETNEWFTTQATPGTRNLKDPAGLAVGDIVISRLAKDGSLLDSMTLPDAGHGMGLIVRFEAAQRVLYTCWFDAGPAGGLYDVVRIPYAQGLADRASATTIVSGVGYPLDPSYDVTTDAVTVRHQGGGGPEYTRHTWQDFASGNLSSPTGQIATTDRPPTHQGFCSLGDRFFFLTGAASDSVGGDPARITEYSWRTGRPVAPPLDASGNSRRPDGTYPGGRMEPEGATIVIDQRGEPSLLVGVTDGGGPTSNRPKTSRTFRYPLIER